MQCVGRDHRSGEVEVGQQRLEGGDLLWGAAYLLLGQHGAGGMVHRGEQVDLALAVVGCAAGAAEGLAVDRDRPSLPSSLIMVVAMVVAAGKPCADRCGQGLGVKPGEGAADRGFGRDRPDPSAGAAIAVTDRAPARTAAAASTRMATSGCRRPARALGSVMVAR